MVHGWPFCRALIGSRIYAFDISGSHKYQIAIRPAVKEDAPGSLWLAPVSVNRNSDGNCRDSVAFDVVWKFLSILLDVARELPMLVFMICSRPSPFDMAKKLVAVLIGITGGLDLAFVFSFILES